MTSDESSPDGAPKDDSQAGTQPVGEPRALPAEKQPVRPRIWPAAVIVALQWAVILEPMLRAPGSIRHAMQMAFAPLVAAVAMLIWWLFASRIPWRDRLLGVLLAVALLGSSVLVVHPSLHGSLLFQVLPVMLTVVVAALIVFSGTNWRRRRLLVAASVCVAVTAWWLVRVDGMDGSMNFDFAFRWSSTAEERFLESSYTTGEQGGNADTAALAVPAAAEPEDWPEFRGVRRDGVVRAVTFSTDWAANPPRELWRRPVGPAWSSFAVVDSFLFTQEQRGKEEVVVCYRCDTGQQCWVNATECRFIDTTAASGPGPRATPTFSEGQLFTMGATGTLQCVDAGTGATLWSRNVVEDVGAKQQLWGCASSPLVVDGVVIVFAGGPNGKSVVSCDRTDGAILWTGGQGLLSYSSPQLANGGEHRVVLMLSDHGLEVFDPHSGEIVWDYPWKMAGGTRIIQPKVVDHDHLIIAEDYSGARMVQVTHGPSDWTGNELWSSRQLKPYFNDFIYHHGHCYGFDGKIFACVDAADGKRNWKGGRYGFGQVLLISDIDALLVLSEQGRVVLLEATPEGHHELGEFQALEGKTWNHPVIAHGRLFVRNSQEAACYALP